MRNGILHSMTLKELREIVGGLSGPSKMPCHGWSIPAKNCITGAVLAEEEGTPCFDCYALKNRYLFANVQIALERRLARLEDPRWVDAMIELINRLEAPPKGSGYFRWFDSGDLQSIEHLQKIVLVANGTPTVKHWLPTREVKFVWPWLVKYKAFPENLTVRISGNKVDMAPPSVELPTSTVVTHDWTCPAKSQGNKCGDCRACWDRNVKNVSYPKH